MEKGNGKLREYMWIHARIGYGFRSPYTQRLMFFYDLYVIIMQRTELTFLRHWAYVDRVLQVEVPKLLDLWLLKPRYYLKVMISW